ncbi:D-alanyl-D-alanine carboxypeptidase family protein [Microbacterium dauci]|uniref:Peptidase S11 D-alanyl-D-alanine carboxypeptidase A N-terminal domain-containing protein n=1 Tax=Microbacterium dauci TaxID=3048008 RepID=A0ABT6ZDT6_9MICO|nr:hypothetical protein [Microbacterium sp. LX3-4]MDJ1114329.1 hypothetical protein [Microbacterium sp. LX3-4]
MEDATPLTRRQLRAQAGDAPSAASDTDAADLDAPETSPTDPPLTATGRIALTWVDDDALRPEPSPQTSEFELLPPLRRPRRRFDARIAVVPTVAVIALAIAYVAGMLLWPLSAVEPNVTTAEATPLRGGAASVEWPTDGAGAVSVSGFSTAASTDESVQLASLTKLVTALVVLDEAPLEVGEQGPSYDFVFADRSEYWQYIAENQSALNVPDGGSLTQYELLQGMLIASASNYADRLATELFGSVEAYTDAANAWLDANGLADVTVTDASGFDRDNTATPRAIVALAKQAMANPVIAEIVATPSAELEGAGFFENTNELLGTDGVVGIKTGSYGGYYNLVAARTASVGGEEVTIFGAVTGQPTDALRVEEAARLLDEVTADAATPSTLAAGTVVASVTTAWGASANIVTDADASLLLWNAASAETDATIDLGDERAAGDDAGTLALTGPAGATEVGLVLDDAVPGPDMWWRLSHPLELLGII